MNGLLGGTNWYKMVQSGTEATEAHSMGNEVYSHHQPREQVTGRDAAFFNDQNTSKIEFPLAHFADWDISSFRMRWTAIGARANTHEIPDTRYRNFNIGEDLAKGVLGLGFVLVQGRHVPRITRGLDFSCRTVEFPQEIWRWIKRTFGIKRRLDEF